MPTFFQNIVKRRESGGTQLSGAEPVCLCWPVLTAFIRIGTNRRLHRRLLTLKEAVERVQSWLDQPCVRMIHPGEQHWPIFQAMLRDGEAIATLCRTRISLPWWSSTIAFYKSTDADFSRFKDVKWKFRSLERRKRDQVKR
jgi:uncharacterized protein